MDFQTDYDMTIDGRATGAEETFEVVNPATETVVVHAPDCSEAQLDEAIAAARRAFGPWSMTTSRRGVQVSAGRLSRSSTMPMRLPVY